MLLYAFADHTIVTGGLVVITAATWAFAQGQKFPGPGSGVMTVAGTVNIGNRPRVMAAQEGDWKVSIANAPEVRVSNTPSVALAPLPFLKTGTRYVVIWPTSESEVIEVTLVGSGGWVRVGRRWVNLAVARSISEAP